MTTHTPGPWEINEHNESEWQIVRRHFSGRQPEIATLDYTGGNAEANARLIAAAPAMLEALKAMQGQILFNKHQQPRKAANTDDLYGWLQLVNAAIAAATGGNA